MKTVAVFQPATEKDQGTVHGAWTASTHYVLLMPMNQPLVVLTRYLNGKSSGYYSTGRPSKKKQVMNLNLK